MDSSTNVGLELPGVRPRPRSQPGGLHRAHSPVTSRRRAKSRQRSGKRRISLLDPHQEVAKRRQNLPLITLHDGGNVEVEPESIPPNHSPRPEPSRPIPRPKARPSSSVHHEHSFFPSLDVTSTRVSSQYHVPRDEDSPSKSLEQEENVIYLDEEFSGLKPRHTREWDQPVSFSELTPSTVSDWVPPNRKHMETISTDLILQEDDSGAVTDTKTPVKYAHTVQSRIHGVYSLCRGLLGGLGLAHFVLMCSAVGPYQDLTAFASVYSAVAMPYHALFFFLSAVCMMSTLDKCCFISLYDIYVTIMMKPSLIVILVVYAVTFVLTCLVTYWDLQLVTATHNNTYSEHLPGVLTWKILSLLRCLGGMLGYLLSSLFPSNDLILVHLNKMQESASMSFMNLS